MKNAARQAQSLRGILGFVLTAGMWATPGLSMEGMGGMPGMGGTHGGRHNPPQSSSPVSQPISLAGDAVLVVNGGSGTLSVIDVASSQVKATIGLGDAAYPHHINLDPTRSRLVVAVPGMDMSHGHHGGMPGMEGKLLLLDAKTGQVLVSRTVDGMNHNGVFSPDGSEIWTALMNSPGSVLVLDSQTLATKETIAVGNSPAEVTFSKDGNYVFVANGASNTVTVIDPATKAVIKTIAVGEDPVGAWQGSDDLMYVDAETGKNVLAIDAKTLEVVRTYDLDFTPGMAVTSPQGELWVSDGDNGKVTYFMAGMAMKMGDIPTGAGAHAIAFSSDGSKAYVTNQFADTVSVVDVASHTVVQAIAVGHNPNGVVYRAK